MRTVTDERDTEEQSGVGQAPAPPRAGSGPGPANQDSPERWRETAREIVTGATHCDFVAMQRPTGERWRETETSTGPPLRPGRLCRPQQQTGERLRETAREIVTGATLEDAELNLNDMTTAVMDTGGGASDFFYEYREL